MMNNLEQEPTMNTVDSAARMFFLLSETSRLLTEAHTNGCKWKSAVELKMTPGSPNPRTKDDLPKPTGGYEIHIFIDPPTA